MPEALSPFYNDGHGIVIYNGDCREILPLLPMADLVLTDPPYGMAFRSNYRSIKHDPIVGDSALDLDAIAACIQKARCAAYVCCRWDNLREMPPPEVGYCLG